MCSQHPWETTRADSQAIGVFRLCWLIALFVLKTGLSGKFVEDRSAGRGSGSFRDSVRWTRTAGLVVRPILDIPGARRWRLTYELDRWRGLMPPSYGTSWAASGDSAVGDVGEETLAGPEAPSPTPPNGIISI